MDFFILRSEIQGMLESVFKIVFCQMYVSPCGKFGPNERSVWAVLIGFGLICRSAWRGGYGRAEICF